ncbi:histidine phosphatase family protein [uncultured Ramlibacter sp.]|uniref:histidine phosphatase family protein n=1 Tax=uncultured Ramlibacter sp. TaxID=260755 RepID=UPI002608D96A|nr:histidine phosphatase family protein [uncultured Ramlibacter sp.]
MKLWLVRHAAPCVEAGICYGSTDLPSDAAATAQAAFQLAAVLPQGLALATSPLQRCEQLAQCLRELRADLPLKSDARLAEMDFGAWEGRRWDAIGEAALAQWTADFWQHHPGGGESLAQFMARVGAAFDDSVRAGRDAVWITHAGVIRAVQLLITGQRSVQHAHQWPVQAPAFGAWQVLEVPA